jgi:formylglycine-generating enzyme required for sulfatase activity
MGRYEVTVDQYKACVEDTGGCKNANPMALKGPVDRPVRFISWDEAVEYCKWLDGKLRSWSGTPGPLAAALNGARGTPGWKVRLPSEAEWEKAPAARRTRLYQGDTIDPSKANYGNPDQGARPRSASSGSSHPYGYAT